MKTLFATALLALAVAACGGAGATTAPGTSAPTGATAPTAAAPTDAPVDGQVVIVKDFTLDPIDVTSGTAVSLAVTNEGPTLHNVAIRDEAGTELATTTDLREGESETLAVELAAGTYTLFCSLPGHESLGIKGTLTVE
jgi:uncharacterized cupredoxin-like copper-binding protein